MGLGVEAEGLYLLLEDDSLRPLASHRLVGPRQAVAHPQEDSTGHADAAPDAGPAVDEDLTVVRQLPHHPLDGTLQLILGGRCPIGHGDVAEVEAMPSQKIIVIAGLFPDV